MAFSGTEAVQYVLHASRRDAEDRSAADVILVWGAVIDAASTRRTIQRAFHLNEPGQGVFAIARWTEAVQHFLRAACRDAEDRSAAKRLRAVAARMRASVHRCAVQRAARVVKAVVWDAAIGGWAK